MVSLHCLIYDHEEDDGQIFFDIPLHPSKIDDKHLNDGFVCKRHYHCKHCNTFIDSKLADVTDDNVADYYDWFEQQYGIRLPA